MALASQGTRQVGRYLLCDQIGAGGMATIHLARLLGPQGFSRTVAVKQLYPQFAQNPEFVAMFLDEARLAVRIRHGNVVSPIDVVASDGELLIVMDYVNGESLAALLREAAGPLPPPLASAILVQVLLGLHAAHEATLEQGGALGLVHRDVSPQNIMVGQDGVARVLDFGIAKAVARSQTTEGGTLKGKIGYMAPEQLRLEAVDRRADLFTAAIVLWEALTGRGLFQADAFGASIEMILHGNIAPASEFNPAVSPELDRMVVKALAREPSDRFQDALSMAAALQSAAPPASTLEVINWVERLAGAELARKAKLVRRAETRSWEGVELPKAGQEPVLEAAALARQAPTNRIETVSLTAFAAAPEESADSAPNLAVNARDGSGPSTARIVPGLSVTVETAGNTGDSKRTRSARALWPKDRRRLLALGVAALLLAATALLLGRTPTHEVSLSSARSAESLAGQPASAASLPALATPNPAASESAPRVELVGPGEPQVTLALPAPAVSARAEATTRARVVTTATPATATHSLAAKPSEKKTSPRKQVNCNPPWTMNEQHIKVFKAECLR